MKNLKNSLLILCILLLTGMYPPVVANAGSVVKKGSEILFDDAEEIEFELNKSGVLFFEFTVQLCEAVSDGKQGINFKLEVFDSEESYYDYFQSTDPIIRVSYDLKLRKNENIAHYSYYPGLELPEDSYCVLSVSPLQEIRDDESYLEFTYKATQYRAFATDLKVPSKLTVKTDDYKMLNMSDLTPSGSFHGAEISSSNKKIADVVWGEDWNAYVAGKKEGECTITITLMNGKKYTCKVTVKNPAPAIKYTSCELYKGQAVTNKILYTDKKVVWSSSNKKIATVNSKGKITAKAIGNCTITAKCNGKTYKAKVKVIYRNPDFVAEINEYNTRNNYFVLKIKNYAKKSLTIYSDKAKAYDFDYKSFDRKLKLSSGKSIVIKPGKTKYLKFKVIGSNTWPDPKDFQISYYFKYDGKKYHAKAYYDPEDSVYKKGSKYYPTYDE